MTDPIIQIHHQDESLEYKDIKEAIVAVVKEDNQNFLFIKIDTEEIEFTGEQMAEFEKQDKYPLISTFNFVNIELEGYPVDFASPTWLLDNTLRFKEGWINNDNETIAYATLYIRAHFEIKDNTIRLLKQGEAFILEWTGVTKDINYYDETAKPNSIFIRTAVQLKSYSSVDNYYEIEYRSKLKNDAK